MAEGKVFGVNNVAIKVATKPKFKASCLAILMYTPRSNCCSMTTDDPINWAGYYPCKPTRLKKRLFVAFCEVYWALGGCLPPREQDALETRQDPSNPVIGDR